MAKSSFHQKGNNICQSLAVSKVHQRKSLPSSCELVVHIISINSIKNLFVRIFNLHNGKVVRLKIVGKMFLICPSMENGSRVFINGSRVGVT